MLAYLCGYSYAKRFTRWSHLYLGSAIAFSPVAAWLAVHPWSLGWPACILMAAVTLWIAGFDVIYACQDIEVDRREGLFSLPARWGAARALWMARGWHAVVVVLLAVRGGWSDPHRPWWSMSAAAGVAVLALALGLRGRQQGYAYVSVVAAALATTFVWIGPWTGRWEQPAPQAWIDLFLANLIAVALASLVWLVVELFTYTSPAVVSKNM